MTFIKLSYRVIFVTKQCLILADIYWAGTLLPEIIMILFTQSTPVLHKYLNDELKVLCYKVSLDYTYSLNFPCSEKSLSIAGFPVLWPLCINIHRVP